MNTPKEANEDLRSRLTADQYYVTQEAGTEPAFSGCYWDTKEAGVYHCVVCDTELFSSSTKFDSGTGWPSFWDGIHSSSIITRTDNNYGMITPNTIQSVPDACLNLAWRWNDITSPQSRSC